MCIFLSHNAASNVSPPAKQRGDEMGARIGKTAGFSVSICISSLVKDFVSKRRRLTTKLEKKMIAEKRIRIYCRKHGKISVKQIPYLQSIMWKANSREQN
jgi:hypothetical protein